MSMADTLIDIGVTVVWNWLFGTPNCKKCNQFQASGKTKCCEQPICQRCAEASIKKSFLGFGTLSFKCPFCGIKMSE